METTINPAAKAFLNDNRTALVASITVVAGDAARKATAAQTMALTSYKAFDANGGVIPAADIAAFLNIDETGLKKLKQYVSRAKKLFENRGARFIDKDGASVIIDHDAITGQTPPSLTTLYKEYMAHGKRLTEAAERAEYDRQQELKAAIAYVESGADMPDGVTNADELLAKARASSMLGLENDFTAALAMGAETVAQENADAMQAQECADILTKGQALIDALLTMGSTMAGDTLSTLLEYADAQRDVAIQQALAA